MKKILIMIVIVICMICAYSIGYSNGNKNAIDNIYGNVNSDETKEIETEKDKKTKEFEKEGYVLNENVKVDIEDFKDVKYSVSDDMTATKLILKNDGSICKFNLGKKFSNESHVLKLNSKITGEIAVGIVDDNCENYWFVLKDYTVLKLDTINDKLTKEKELPNNIMFRSYSIVEAIKKMQYDKIITIWTSSLAVLKDNIVYVVDYDDVANKGTKPFVEENKRGHVPSEEQVLLLERDFVRTDKAVYKYCLLNEEEVNNYADIKEEYGYKKLEISKYLNEVVYIDCDCVIMNDGTVYV